MAAPRRGLRPARIGAASIVGALVSVGTAVTIAGSDSHVWRDLGLAVLSGGIVGGVLVLVESLLSSAATQRAEHAALLSQLSTTIDLSGIDLRGRDLGDLYLPGRTIVAGQLVGATLDRAKLYWSSFRHTLLRDASLRDVDASGSTFAYGDLRGADLSGAVLRDCDLSRARLDGANLSGADLTGSSIEGTSFVGARLDGARFVECALRGADFTGASVSTTVFDRNEYDATTTWPAGVVPAPSVLAPRPDVASMKLDAYLAWRIGRS